MILTEPNKTRLRALYTAALESADAYDGSSRAADALLDPLTDIEKLLIAQNNGARITPDLEISFASAAGIAHPKSVWDILDDALAAAYRRMQQVNSFDDFLNQLERAGALVVRSDDVFVKTDDGQINSATSDTPKSFEYIREPRLAWLIKGLQTIGEHTDHMIIRVGKVAPNMVRREHYVVVELPDRNKQIAVCGQRGEITFVSTEIIDPKAFDTYTKSQLKSLPMMRTVRMTDPPSGWLSSILDIIKETPAPEKYKRLNLAAHERARKPKALPLSEEIIIEAIHDWAATHDGQYPTKTSGLIETGKLKGNTWLAFDRALANGNRGLPGGSSLADLMHRYKIKENRLSPDRHLTEAMIIEAIHEWAATHDGQYPTEYSGPIETRKLKGNTWLAIDTALANGNRGLPGGSSLAKLKRKLNATLDAIARAITPLPP